METKKTIKKTKDYSIFKFLKGNRRINEKHLKRLTKSIKENHLFTILYVNKNMEILDGQHRFLALKENKLPINYCVVGDDYNVEEVQIYNSNSYDWTAQSCMESYASLNKKEYIIYQNFYNKYKFPHTATLMILSDRINSLGDLSRSFKKGDLIIKNIDKANLLAEKLIVIGGLYKGYKRSNFVKSIIQLIKKGKFDIDLFIKKLKLQPNTLVDCVKMSDYMNLIEKIYNFRNRNKVNLRF